MNPTILDMVKKEVTKLLTIGIIYPILDSQWVSPVQVVPKKSGMTVKKNQQDELATRKDHFPLPFIDQVLENLAGKSHYCFLDGFSGYMQIHIAPEDQHKTTFTCPSGTFAYTHIHLACATRRKLKSQLTFARILQTSNWELPFKLMCDASNLTLGVVLDQIAGVGKPMNVIAYASRTMDSAQTTEKELLAIVFALNKFRPYLLGSKIIVFFDHATLRFLLKKLGAKLKLLGWMLFRQELNIEIRDKKGAKSSIVDHLSRIEREIDLMPIRDEFPDEQLLHITMPTPWFADICNFVATSQFPLEASRLYMERLQNDAKYYIWDAPYLWRLCNDQHLEAATMDQLVLPRKCLIAGSIGPPFSGTPINSSSFAKKCQKAGMAISRRHEMPQQPILFCEVFDVWGIDFMGSFLVSNGYFYILLAVDYVSRWVEAIATKTNDAKVVVDFLKSNIFYRFGVPKALISDQGSHFYNRAMSSLLHKYGVMSRIATSYHP
ncbi:Retrovirus-related Pol polyprotein, partial [Mucuna pruriens]